MRVAIYTRVSTQEQTTLNQELELKKFCESQGFEVFKIYSDTGISGSKTSRPQLDLMLQDMRNKLFEGIIVWKLDRLGRSIQHLLQLLEEFNNKSIRLICLDMQIDTSTNQGKLFFTIVGAFAEFERGLIKERIYLGLERARAEGKHLGRPEGSKDKKSRNKLGYWKRWSKK